MISSVQQFNSYAVGNKIRFWHWSDRRWTKGEIVEIKQAQGYFVCLRIRYYKVQQSLEIEIFREDWLQDAVGEVES